CGGGLTRPPPILIRRDLTMCICLTASQAVLEQIARQFGILAALFFLLGITFSVGCTSGAKLLYSLFLTIKNKKIRREHSV
ncbi:hypothetical protein AALA99_16310, partial [Anaerotruncus colihominis]